MADLVLIDPSGSRSSIIQCLVDTGADYTVIPTYIVLGFNVTSTSPFSVTTAGGYVTYNIQTGVDVEIEGFRIKTDILFDPSPSAAYIPILGRVTLLSAFDFGFNINEWLYD
jgi:predicted aspartyl protease